MGYTYTTKYLLLIQNSNQASCYLYALNLTALVKSPCCCLLTFSWFCERVEFLPEAPLKCL